MKYIAKDEKIPRKKIIGAGNLYSKKSIFCLKEIVSLEDHDEIDKKSRAFYYPPHEPAYFIINNKKYFILPKAIYYETEQMEEIA